MYLINELGFPMACFYEHGWENVDPVLIERCASNCSAIYESAPAAEKAEAEMTSAEKTTAAAEIAAAYLAEARQSLDQKPLLDTGESAPPLPFHSCEMNRGGKANRQRKR